MPDGKNLSIGKERFMCTEQLFNPTEPWDTTKNTRESLQNLVNKAI